jgi:ferric-dicitrate binding protein FerR (iron transport regulator)
MDISKFTAEDFVLDKEFRLWILKPNLETNIIWDNLLSENPNQLKNIKIAREIVLNLSFKDQKLTEKESWEIWQAIDREIDGLEPEEKEIKIVPLSSGSTLRRHDNYSAEVSRPSQIFRVAAILVIAFGLSILSNLVFPTPEPIEIEPIFVYEEHSTPPGVKSTLTLHDGSKVILNSGSSLRYLKNFEADKRILYLTGEAFFEVKKDSIRPFSVITGDVVTTALGTSFNISAYKNEDLNISLLTGKVTIDATKMNSKSVFLERGEALTINLESKELLKGSFDVDQEIGWTQKRIIFEKVKLTEAIRVIENWYGVEFIFQNKPNPSLLLSGIFQDETLENVLGGLSYTARFDFKINEDIVTIKFK